MIDIDITMPIQIANILLLIVIMNAVLYKPIRTILEQREKRLADLENEITTFNKNASLRLEEFDRKMNDARRKGKANLEEVRAVAQSEGNAVMAGIRKEADAAKAAQMDAIKAEFAKAREELKGQIDGFAVAMTEKVLGRSL